MTVSLADLLLGIALIVAVATASLLFSFWRRVRKEFIAARIAVGNLQLRMAEMEAKNIQAGKPAKPPPVPPSSYPHTLDQAIDSCADPLSYKNRRPT